MIAQSFSLSSTPTLVYAARPGAETIYLHPGNQDVFVGGSDVTSLTGLALIKNATNTIVIPTENELYAVVATGTHTVKVLSAS